MGGTHLVDKMLLGFVVVVRLFNVGSEPPLSPFPGLVMLGWVSREGSRTLERSNQSWCQVSCMERSFSQ